MSNYPGALSGGFISHRFQSLKPDQPDLSVVNATNWNQSHIIGSGAIQSGALGASMVNSGNITALSVTSGAIASGATSWNLFGPSKPFVTVTPNGPTDGGDYGPNTPGTTTAGIQEAINAVSVGGLVFLSRGVYTITAAINITKLIHLTGAGTGPAPLGGSTVGGAIVSIGAANITAAIIVNGSSASNTEIDHIKVLGNSGSYAGNDGILIENAAAHIQLHDLVVNNIDGIGINDNNAGDSQCLFRDLIVEDCHSHGVNISSGHSELTNVLSFACGTVVNNNRAAINIKAGDVTLVGCEGQGSYYGFQTDTLSPRAKFIGCFSETNYRTGFSINSSDTSVVGCHATDSGGAQFGGVDQAGFYFGASNIYAAECFTDANVGVGNHQSYAVAIQAGTAAVQIINSDLTGNQISPFYGSIPADCVVKNCTGYNPVGLVSAPIVSGLIGPTGVSGTAAIASGITYRARVTDLLITSMSGNSLIIVTDSGGNSIVSGLNSLNGFYLPIGYRITWGAFTSSPTVSVFAN